MGDIFGNIGRNEVGYNLAGFFFMQKSGPCFRRSHFVF